MRLELELTPSSPPISHVQSSSSADYSSPVTPALVYSFFATSRSTAPVRLNTPRRSSSLKHSGAPAILSVFGLWWSLLSHSCLLAVFSVFGLWWSLLSPSCLLCVSGCLYWAPQLLFWSVQLVWMTMTGAQSVFPIACYDLWPILIAL